MLDVSKKGWLTAPDLHDVLQDFQQYCHKDDVNTFIRRFDMDADGRLLYSDFCDAFTPLEQYHSQVLNTRQSFFVHRDLSVFQYFSLETRNLFFKCFKTHFEIEESIELIKQRMTRRPKFNITDIFTHLDIFEDGNLSRECFKRVLQENKFFPSDGELSLLYNRFDRNRNGSISYQEFTEEIMPKNSLTKYYN